MVGAFQILAHTPVYVWFLLSYLVWQGLAATRTRNRPLWRLLTVPFIFMVLGIWPLIGKSASDIKLVGIWLGAGFLLALPGIVTGPRVIARDATSRELTISGSVVPFVRNMTLFVLHYALAVALALSPDGAQILTMAGYALSGGSIGYFAGWAFALRRHLHDIPIARHSA
ncbi:DUF6622 family protein [Rhizobium sp.]|uniref:DUF6622 family protein n=1 Tax=Rhizobium sp. TaxID=391 RepID=UPI0028AC03C3